MTQIKAFNSTRTCFGNCTRTIMTAFKCAASICTPLSFLNELAEIAPTIFVRKRSSTPHNLLYIDASGTLTSHINFIEKQTSSEVFSFCTSIRRIARRKMAFYIHKAPISREPLSLQRLAWHALGERQAKIALSKNFVYSPLFKHEPTSSHASPPPCSSSQLVS